MIPRTTTWASRRIRIGSILKDNDPRLKEERLLYVRKIHDGFAYCDTDTTGIPTRVRMDRIHSDGKPRRTGYDVVTDELARVDAIASIPDGPGKNVNKLARKRSH